MVLLYMDMVISMQPTIIIIQNQEMDIKMEVKAHIIIQNNRLDQSIIIRIIIMLLLLLITKVKDNNHHIQVIHFIMILLKRAIIQILIIIIIIKIILVEIKTLTKIIQVIVHPIPTKINHINQMMII